MRIRMVFFTNPHGFWPCRTSESLIAFYKLLKETFPLEGMVMHHFLPSSQSLLNSISSTTAASTSSGGSFRFPVKADHVPPGLFADRGVNAIPNSQEVRTAESVNNDLRECTSKNRPRAHLVCCASRGGRAARPVAASSGRRWAVSQKSMSGGWACWRFP